MSVRMPFERYDLLRQVNYEINRDTRYRTDIELYGRPEFWEIANGAGDCEDYTLAKRWRLWKESGVALEDLRICIVFTELEAGQRALTAKRAGADMVMGDHAVLVGTSPIGDWILDNRYPLPVQLSDTPYVVDRIQVAGTTDWEHGENPWARKP